MRRLLITLSMIASTGALAAPVLREQRDQRGNFVLIGNILGIDCQATTPDPVVGAVGSCGSSLGDTAPDVFWRSDAPIVGDALADTTVTAADARSTAVLELPPGAVITYARLYWAARTNGTVHGPTAVLERPGTFTAAVNADNGITTVRGTGGSAVRFYQSSADVTDVVRDLGVGAFRVGNIETVNLVNLDEETTFIGWGMVVFYALDTDPPRQLSLFDGLELLPPAGGGTSVTTTIDGFLVPNTGFDAKLGVMSYEGDSTLTGDQFSFNGTALAHGGTSLTNFFDGSRTDSAGPISRVGDLPQLTGEPGSNTGVDFHELDVTALLAGGSTSATVTASTVNDVFLLGVFVTSISTLKPIFTETSKGFTDLNGGDIRVGDVIEYEIATRNTGSDVGVELTLTDPLPAQVTFVPGSLSIVTGPNAGVLTDAPGDDVGEYDGGSHTVVVRLGAGATAIGGGALAVGESTSVRFRVQVAVSSGEVVNQAHLSARGQAAAGQGLDAVDFISDSSFSGAGEPTTFPIDECSLDSDCPAPARRCDTSVVPNVCLGCLASTDCPASAPVCETTSHSCAGCATHANCTDPALPLCNANTHGCVAELPPPPPAPARFEGAGCGGCSASGGAGLGALWGLLLLLSARRRS